MEGQGCGLFFSVPLTNAMSEFARIYGVRCIGVHVRVFLSEICPC